MQLGCFNDVRGEAPEKYTGLSHPRTPDNENEILYTLLSGHQKNKSNRSIEAYVCINTFTFEWTQDIYSLIDFANSSWTD